MSRHKPTQSLRPQHLTDAAASTPPIAAAPPLTYEEQQEAFHREAEERDAAMHARRLEHEAAAVGLTAPELKRRQEAALEREERTAARPVRRRKSHGRVKGAIKRAVRKVKAATRKKRH